MYMFSHWATEKEGSFLYTQARQQRPATNRSRIPCRGARAVRGYTLNEDGVGYLSGDDTVLRPQGLHHTCSTRVTLKFRPTVVGS